MKTKTKPKARPAAPTKLFLIENKKAKIVYPKAGEDYDALKYLGVSVKFCHLDFVPLLRTYAKTKKVTLVLESFEDVEAKALATLQSRWPGGFERPGKFKIVLSCPKDDQHFVLVKSVKASLARFYATHGMKLTYQIKRGSKNVKVTFTTEVSASVFVTQDER